MLTIHFVGPAQYKHRWVHLIWLSTSETTTFDIAGLICVSTKTVRRKNLICHNEVISQDNFPFVIAGRIHKMVQTFYFANAVACADEMRRLRSDEVGAHAC